MRGKDAEVYHGRQGGNGKLLKRILVPAVWLRVDGCTTTSTHTVGWVRMRSPQYATNY